MESYMEKNTFATVVWRTNSIDISNQPDDYIALIDKLIQLDLNDSTKFQEQLKAYTQPKSIKQKHELN